MVSGGMLLDDDEAFYRLSECCPLSQDESLTDTDSLPPSGVIAAEIVDDLETALEQFTKIAERLAR